jgi:hypothetical protein
VKYAFKTGETLVDLNRVNQFACRLGQTGLNAKNIDVCGHDSWLTLLDHIQAKKLTVFATKNTINIVNILPFYCESGPK